MKANIANAYRERMTAEQVGQAEVLIRSVQRSCTHDRPCCGQGSTGGGAFTVTEGTRLALPDGSVHHVRCLTAKRSVGSVVCAAVLAGILPVDQSGTSRQEPQGQDQQDTGDSQDQQQQQQDAGEAGEAGQGQDGQDPQDAGECQGQGQDQQDGQDGQQDGQPEGQDQQQDQQDQQQDTGNEYVRLANMLDGIADRLDREAGGDPNMREDQVSNRPWEYGRDMIDAGLPADAVVHAWAADWPAAKREDWGIPTFSPTEWGADQVEPGQHGLFPYVLRLVEAGVPALLVGPTGSGKGYLTRQVFDRLALRRLVTVPMNESMSPGWLIGMQTVNPDEWFVESGFMDVYRNGGMVLLDEVDAADSNLLLLINEAVANGWFTNPVTGETVRMHPAFRLVMAANTWGAGADRRYTGRNALDGASLDRVRPGRVMVDYDRTVQRRILLEGRA